MSRFSRQRTGPWFSTLVLALLASLQGCDCGSTGVDTRRFACAQDDECAPGFVCREDECQLEGGPVGTPDGGGSRQNQLTFLSPAQTLPAGGCSTRVEIESRDATGNPLPVPSQTRVMLSGQGAAGFSFFSDSGCTTPINEAVLAPGAVRTGFYFKGRTGGTFSLSAAAPGFLTASQNETLLPVVRSGVCTLPAGAGTVTCPISPAQLDRSKTLLLFQASSNDPDPDTASLACSLSAQDAFTCRRNDFDDGGEPTVRIVWQTAELASGLKVQHLQGSCRGTPMTEVDIQPVASLGSSFVLVSSEQDGSTQGEDDFYTASFSTVDHVDFQFSVNCQSTWHVAFQVVELSGTRVTRGLTESMVGSQLVVSNLEAVDLASTALLFTYRVSGVTTLGICDRILRGELTSPTSITFSRGAGAEGCAGAIIDSISWERIDFGERARAQHVPVTMDAATQSVSLPITAVDPTRTLVFAGGQSQSGQAGGETSYATDEVIGAALGWHSLTSPTVLEVSRGAAAGTAKWSSTVLQLEP
jgi:hypothetical protein